MSSELYHIHQFWNEQFSQFSYYIESYLEAAIVDPQREIQPYLEYLEERGARLKYILMTHIPSDYVSGHVDLFRETGAMIIFGSKFSHYGENQASNYSFSFLERNQTLKLGNVTIGVVNTPGHSIESVSYSLLNGVIMDALFTGDSLLLGSIGAPDIVVLDHYNKHVDKSQGHQEFFRKDLCDMLHDTIYNKLFYLPIETIIYPGHGNETPHVKFVKPGGDTNFTQISDEKIINPFFKFNSDKEGFFDYILKTECVVKPRPYYDSVVKLNILGYERFEESLNSLSVELDLNSMENIIKQNQIINEHEENKYKRNLVFIDTRECETSIEEHLPGSILIDLVNKFPIWTGTLIDHETEIVVITNPGDETAALSYLINIGHYHIKGYFTRVSELLKKIKENNSLITNHPSQNNNLVTSIKNISDVEVPKYLYNSNYKLLDVREKEEFEQGSFSHSINFPLSQMEEKFMKNNFEEVSRKIPKGENLYVFCATGTRSLIAVSILQTLGYTNLFNLNGGVKKIKERGIQLTKMSESNFDEVIRINN